MERRSFLDVCAIAMVVAPALVVVPLAGIDPGAQSALKLTVSAFVLGALVCCVRVDCALSGVERALIALVACSIGATMAAGQSLSSAVPVIAGLIMLGQLAWTSRRLLFHRWSVIELAVIVSVTLVGGCAVLELAGVHLPWAPVRRPASTLGNRNHVAQYLVISIPILIASALRGRRAALPVLTLAFAVVVVARCRSAYLGLACALLVLPVVTRLLRGQVVAGLRPVVVAIVLGIAIGFAPWPGVRFAVSVTESTSRVFVYDVGSGLARIHQHHVGIEALWDQPARAAIGFGAGTWEHVASSYAHAIGAHTPRFTSSMVPNSESLRIVVEQGLLGLALVLLVLVLVVRQLVVRRDPSSALRRASMLASLCSAGVCGLFDPLLVRMECVALLGIVIGAGAATGTARGSLVRIQVFIAAVLVCAGTLRTASFLVSSPRSLAGRLPGGAAWEQRLDLAATLSPRPGLDERKSLGLVARGRCAAAERALARFIAVRPHHWGARDEVARCYARAGHHDSARRLWADVLATEPHLFSLTRSLSR